MRRFFIILNIASLIGAFIMLMVEQSWGALASALGLTGSLISLIYSNSKTQSSNKLTQTGSKKSKNYQ